MWGSGLLDRKHSGERCSSLFRDSFGAAGNRETHAAGMRTVVAGLDELIARAFAEGKASERVGRSWGSTWQADRA